MQRTRTIGAGIVLALATVACQSGESSPSASVAGVTQQPASPSGMASEAPSGSPTTSAEPSPSGGQLFPVFQARGTSNLTGGAIITEVEGEASVVVGVVAPGAAEALPLAIVEGDCATQQDPGPTPPAELVPSPAPSGSAPAAASPSAPAASPSAPAGASPSASAPTELTLPHWLTPVMVGSSNSVIPATVSDLLAAPHSIIIETSPTDPTIIACADIAEGAPAPASPGASAAPGGSPATSPEASPTSS